MANFTPLSLRLCRRPDLFFLYASLICRFTRLRFTARLKRRLETLISIDAWVSSSSTGKYTTRKGKMEKDCEPVANNFSITFFLFNLSALRKVFIIL